MLGLGNPTLPTVPGQPPPFTPSGNPVWDEIQQAHSTLSPAAQRAVSLSGVPQRAGEAEAGAASFGQPPTEAAPQTPRPIAGPSSLNVRGLGSPTPAPAPAAQIPGPSLLGGEPRPMDQQSPDPAAPNPTADHLAERNRVVGSGSGISQMHNPFLRGLANVGQAVGSAVLPNVLRFIPGTELHHRDVVNQNENIVNEDVARAKSGADTAHVAAQAEALGSPTPKAGDPTKTIETDQGVMQFNPETGHYDFRVGGGKEGSTGTVHQLEDGSLVIAHPDGKATAVTLNGTPVKGKSEPGPKTVAELAIKNNPKITAEELQGIMTKEPAAAKFSAEDAALIRAVGGDPDKPETLTLPILKNYIAQKQPPQRAPIVNVNTQGNQSYEKRNTELTAIGKPVTDLMGRFGRLQDTIAQGTPQADALVAPELLTVMAGGAGSGLRMNEAEISRIVGGRSHWENLRGAIQKWSLDPKSANSITPDQRQQIRALIQAVGTKLTKKQDILNEGHRALSATDDINEHRRIVNDAREKFSAIDAGEGQGDKAVPIVTTKEQFDALPKGAEFMEDGRRLRKQ